MVMVARMRAELAVAREMADLDSLTGLLNQRSFHELLGHEVARAHRYKRRLALIIVDVDNFKSINDEIGHLEGNAVLNEVAGRVRTAVRAADIACRIGGDEFAVILPESSAADAHMLAGRVVQGVSDPPLPDAPLLSVSAGVGELRDGDSANDLFARADKDLYGAKDARVPRDAKVSRG
jgi:two-component system cell cycle response regulator